jgi:hypothetical protein
VERGLACEVITVFTWVFNLDCHVGEALVVLELVLNLLKSLEWLVRSYVSAASILARGEGPDVQIVNLYDSVALFNCSFNLSIVNICGSGLHQNKQALLDSRV